MNLAQALIRYAQSGGRSTGPLYEALAEHRPAAPPPKPVSMGPSEPSKSEPTAPRGRPGNLYTLPTSWQGTHVTDGLGWGTRTAEDIMLPAGTPLALPVAGTIAYYHPNGAQGGGSEMFKPAGGGHPWWLGHLDAGISGRVRAGQYIGRVSSRHPRPHVHIDRGNQ